MESNSPIEQFLDGKPHAVVGASANRQKYGNMVLRNYLQKNREVYAVNPGTDEIEGVPSFKNLTQIGKPMHGISIITPPAVTEAVVEEAIELGIKHIWMQPGAESNSAIASAEKAGINVIAGGPCLLVVLGFQADA